jgi:pimeloyl-ACP methyl ester carboxylesterase
MSGLLTRAGLLVDTWSGPERMRRFREGWPATASAGVKFYRTPKVQYRYREAGSGQAIVFTADPPMTLENYDKLIEVFAARYRVIVVELPAMGFSATTRGFGFGFRETCDDLALFLRTIAGPGAIFAFSCVAGLAGIDIASRQPDLCARLALLQTGDVAAFDVWKTGRDPKRVLAKPILGQIVMSSLAPKRMPDWYKLSVGRTEQIDALCKCAARSFEHGAMWSLASAYQVFMDPRIQLPVPPQPMQSIWGAADKSHPAQNMHALRRLSPSVTCVTYDELGHTPELEDPERVFETISDFARA